MIKNQYQQNPSMEWIPVCSKDVAEALRTTLNWKAPGRDQITNFLFKQLTATHKHVHVLFSTLRHPRVFCVCSMSLTVDSSHLFEVRHLVRWQMTIGSSRSQPSCLAGKGEGHHSRSQLFVSLCVPAEPPSYPAYALQWQFCISKLSHSSVDILQPVKDLIIGALHFSN